MSKTLKGTYLWNETISNPTQEFIIDFAQTVRTNYGIMAISRLEVHDHGLIVYAFQNGNNYSVYSDTGTIFAYWHHGGFRSITFGDGTSEEIVSDEFYAWFTENAVSLGDTVELTGTWQLNETVLGPHGRRDWIEEEQDYEFNYSELAEGEVLFREDVNASVTISGREIEAIKIVASKQADFYINSLAYTYHIDVVYMAMDIGGTGIDSFKSFEGYTNKPSHYYLGTWRGAESRTITFDSGTTVSSLFYCWLATNAQGVEMCELGGRWKWNDKPLHHTRDFSKVKIKFKSGFKDMEYMLIEPDDKQGVSSDVSYISSDLTYKAYDKVAWTNPFYRIIDFGDEVQEVTKEFYDWFTASATKQSLKQINGVWRLNEVLTGVSTEIIDPYNLAGTWRFNNEISFLSEDFTVEFDGVKITLNGEERSLYKCRVIRTVWGEVEFLGIYYTIDSPYNSDTLVYSNSTSTVVTGVFVDEEYQVLIFDKNASIRIVDDKITREEFYNWFTTNTKLISEAEVEQDLLEAYEPVSFKTYVNDNAYLGMSIHDGRDPHYPFMKLCYCTYSETDGTVEYHQIYREDDTGTTWTHQASNNLIDFGGDSKFVSTEFYNWFTANAVRASYEIFGSWQFTTELSSPPSTSLYGSCPIDFRSNGQSFKNIFVSDDGQGMTITYDTTVVFSDGAWVNSNYRSIRIAAGNVGLRSSEPFYRWFMDNAERICLLIEIDTLFDIADAIRAKTGKTDKIKVSDLKKEIANIPTTSSGIVSVSIREIE